MISCFKGIEKSTKKKKRVNSSFVASLHERVAVSNGGFGVGVVSGVL